MTALCRFHDLRFCQAKPCASFFRFVHDHLIQLGRCSIVDVAIKFRFLGCAVGKKRTVFGLLFLWTLNHLFCVQLFGGDGSEGGNQEC